MQFRVFKAETMKIKETRYHILIRQYKNLIYGYAFYMMKNRMDADDVTQEVLIKIWKNIDSFNYLSAKSWIMKTTHNLCIDYLRKKKRDTPDSLGHLRYGIRLRTDRRRHSFHSPRQSMGCDADNRAGNRRRGTCLCFQI